MLPGHLLRVKDDCVCTLYARSGRRTQSGSLTYRFFQVIQSCSLLMFVAIDEEDGFGLVVFGSGLHYVVMANLDFVSGESQ